MIEHELILLGLLRESPRHGYEIKKEIKEVFSLFVGVDLKSIYYPLRILEKEGFINKSITKSGKRPQRYVYELTAKGESRFQALVAKSFLDFKRPQFSLDLCLYFSKYINPDVAKRRLRARIYILKQLFSDLKQMVEVLKKKKPSPLISIVKHNLKMVEAEAGFLAHFTEQL